MEDNYEVFFHGNIAYKGAQMIVGAVLMNHGEIIDEIGGVVPYKGSQPRAHWEAMVQGMELAAGNNVRRVIMKGDSREVINHMNGQPPGRGFDSMDYLMVARKAQLKFDQSFFQWIPIEKNMKSVTLARLSLE